MIDLNLATSAPYTGLVVAGDHAQLASQINVSDLILTTVISIPIGILVSFLFVKLVYLRRPTVLVSKEIALTHDAFDDQWKYRIKVINKTRVDIVDNTAQLQLVRWDSGHMQSRTLKLHQPTPLVIRRYERNSPDELWAYRFTASFDQLAELDGVKFSHVRFRMVCRHAVSAATTLVEQLYTPDDIVEGAFPDGDSLTVRPAVPSDPAGPRGAAEASG